MFTINRTITIDEMAKRRYVDGPFWSKAHLTNTSTGPSLLLGWRTICVYRPFWSTFDKHGTRTITDVQRQCKLTSLFEVYV